MTHSGKFRLTIGCLDLLASNAKYKVIPVAGQDITGRLEPNDDFHNSLPDDQNMEAFSSFH